MVEKHKRDESGMLLDGVDTEIIDDTDRAAYAASADELAQLSVPVLLRKGNIHDRLLFALFDGTGNDADSDQEHTTSVGVFRNELEQLRKVNKRVNFVYLNGPGTQSNPLTRTLDGALGYTFDARIEQMYRELIIKAKELLDEDPQARISLVNVGFSRGAELAARFSRVVHERGIQDIFGMAVDDRFLREDVVRFTKPALVPPGSTPQAVALFDPVGTGYPLDRDRHLPSSVLAGLQIVARDEKRNLFPSSRIIWPGMSADRHFLSMENAGSHSDIGGSYHIAGLAIRNRNLMATFVNAMSDEELLKIQSEDWDPSLDVIHDSSQHLMIYRTSHHRRNGERDVVGAQESAPDCRKVTYCQPPDPIDPTILASISEWRRVGDQPSLSQSRPEKEITMDMVQEEIITSQKSLAEITAILAEKDPSIGTRIDIHAFDAFKNPPVQSPPTDVRLIAPTPISEPQANVAPGITVTDERVAARLREEREAMAFIESLRQEQLREARTPAAQAQVDAYPKNDPRNERHPDHRMYQSIYLQLGELNAQTNIDASKGEMERVSAALLAEAKRNNLRSVTHMHFGKDKDGGFMPIIHIKEAFHGDPDDPRTRWAAVDATKAADQPIEQSLQRLDDANQNIQQQQLMREAELSQQRGMGMSMSR